jgi:hypothetical protein
MVSVDSLLIPGEALTQLRQARFDPRANRGFNRAAWAFLWSDELLHHVRPICKAQGSRAESCLLAFRSSLIEGRPIEEYRGPWEQLRAAVPEWPGFRPERCSTNLARALRWERRLQRLFPDPVCWLVAFLLALCLLPFMVAVPVGVHITARAFETAPPSMWCWIGAGLQVLGILFWEGFLSMGEVLWRVEAKWSGGERPSPSRVETNLMRGFYTIGQPLGTVLVFLPLMDGGVHFRAGCYVYLLYAVAALPVLALRWKSCTTAEVFFLKWGWAPVIALGLPLLLPLFKKMGWIHIIG